MNQVEIWNKRYGVIKGNKAQDQDVWIADYDKYFIEKKNYSVIDLGCGRGENSLYLYSKGFKVTACDFSSVVLDHIKYINKSILTQCFDMTREFPILGGNIGIVLASLSTHYFSLADTETLYRRIFGILDNDGYFIFRVNSLKEYEENDKAKMISEIEKYYYLLADGTTKRYFSIDSITDLLKSFNVVEIKEDSFIYYGKRKYFVEGIVQKS